MDKFEAYGNHKDLYHGTPSHPSCLFGTSEAAGPCEHESCGVCNIARVGFQVTNKSNRGFHNARIFGYPPLNICPPLHHHGYRSSTSQ